MKISEFDISEHIVANNLYNQLLGSVNLIVGDSGCGKTTALNNIKNELFGLPNIYVTTSDVSKKTAMSDEALAHMCELNKTLSGHALGKGSDMGLKALKSFQPDLKDIDVSDDTIIFNYLLGFCDFGESFNTAFQLVLRTVNVKNGVLLLDNIEQGFSEKSHKAILTYIFDNAAKNNNQVFMSTNSSVFAETFAEFAKNEEDALAIRLGRSVKKSSLGERISVTFNNQELSVMTGKDIIGY